MIYQKDLFLCDTTQKFKKAAFIPTIYATIYPCI